MALGHAGSVSVLKRLEVYSETSMTHFAFYFGLLVFGSMFIRKKKTKALIIGFTIVCFLISCESNNIEPPFVTSTVEHYQTVENLQPDTLYYWKVVAVGTEGINSESTVQTFTTGDQLTCSNYIG